MTGIRFVEAYKLLESGERSAFEVAAVATIAMLAYTLSLFFFAAILQVGDECVLLLRQVVTNTSGLGRSTGARSR